MSGEAQGERMQAALGLPGDPGPWAGQLKGKILGLGPLRPPGTLPLPTARPPHTPLSPPSPAYSLPTPATSGHLCPHIPSHGPPTSTHSTCPLRKFLVQIPTHPITGPFNLHSRYMSFQKVPSSNPTHGSSVSSSGHLPKSRIIGQPVERTH